MRTVSDRRDCSLEPAERVQKPVSFEERDTLTTNVPLARLLESSRMTGLSLPAVPPTATGTSAPPGLRTL